MTNNLKNVVAYYQDMPREDWANLSRGEQYMAQACIQSLRKASEFVDEGADDIVIMSEVLWDYCIADAAAFIKKHTELFIVFASNYSGSIEAMYELCLKGLRIMGPYCITRKDNWGDVKKIKGFCLSR